MEERDQRCRYGCKICIKIKRTDAEFKLQKCERYCADKQPRCNLSEPIGINNNMF